MLSLSRRPCTPGPQGFALSRRNFLIATVETGIVLGYARSAFSAVEFPLAAEHATAYGNLFEPTIWYSIGRDGRITVNIIRAEMGQHVGTALARIVADELARLVYCQPTFFINSARAFDCSRGYHRLWPRDCTG